MPPRNHRVADTGRLSELASMFVAERARRGVSQRQASAELGLPPSTVCRFEQGKMPDVPNFLAILAWLQMPVESLLGLEQPKTLDAYQRGWNDCAATVRAALKGGAPS